MDDGSASLDSVFSAVRAALIAIGGWLAANGYGSSGLYKWTELAAGGVMIIGPAIWGIVSAIQKWRQKRSVAVAGVNAGMRLAVSGQMETHASGVPVPATVETAKQIIKDFAPEQAQAI